MKRKIINVLLLSILLVGILTSLCGCFSGSSSKSSKEPSDIELMSYAQTVLSDNLNNPSYSSNKRDYTFVKNGLRYKIEGYVTVNSRKEKFYLIIEFVNDKYQTYDIKSLQVGNNRIL